MNVRTFSNYSVTCPICQRNARLNPVKVSYGLFICPYCQERLVVSWSGHYVRDPHKCRKLILTQRRRQQRRARVMHDLGFLTRPFVAIALVSAILLGVSVISLEGFNRHQNPLENLIEELIEIVNVPKNRLE